MWVGCYQILAFCTIRAADVDATRNHESCSAASRRMDMCWPNNTFSIATGLAPCPSPIPLFSTDFWKGCSSPWQRERRSRCCQAPPGASTACSQSLRCSFALSRCPDSVPRASSVLNIFCDIRNTLCQESLISRLATSCRVDGPHEFGRISGQPLIFLRALFEQVRNALITESTTIVHKTASPTLDVIHRSGHGDKGSHVTWVVLRFFPTFVVQTLEGSLGC